ncbi:MAG: TatD family hydrolase [Ferruginibacter sp.]
MIDIHTHKDAISGYRAILNRYNRFDELSSDGFFSAGLHPWYINPDNWQSQFRLLEAAVQKPTILAIGECGLDKLCHTNFDLQQTVFKKQVMLANTVHKPLIIHCVKAYDEVLHILQQAKTPVIFHGFNKNAVLAQQLTSKGYYLSFGQALEQQRNRDVLKQLPLNKILLETDDAPVEIAAIYSLAAAALEIDINTLSLQLQKNAAGVFGRNFSLV